MNKKNTNYLLKTYPNLYKQYYWNMKDTCMCWGFMCENGWFKMINELSSQIVKLDKNAEAVEVKEKYGGLRFYVNGNKQVQDLVSKYEEKSYKICEKCGQTGKLRNNDWYATLCDKCYKTWKGKRLRIIPFENE